MRGGGNDETVSTGCGSPSVLHPWMLLLHMQETALWIHRLGPLSSRGGVQISWMLLLHMQETVFVDSPADILAPVLQYHDFPKEGTLSVTRLNVVKESVEK